MTPKIATTLESDVLVIAPGQTSRYWRSVLDHVDLLLLLARKDLQVRYKEMAVGVAWMLIRPAITLLIFTWIFGKIAQLPSGGVPYPILIFSGLLPYLFFAAAMAAAGDSLLTNSALLTKVYFPRPILPIAATLVCLVDFVVTGVLAVPLTLYYGIYFSWNVLVVPVLVAMLWVTALGTGFWLSALTVKYRDFKYITQFLVQMLLYASPVAYASSVIPENWQFLFYLNPLAGLIDAFRWAVTDGRIPLQPYAIVTSVVLGTLLLVTGAAYFRKTEHLLADRL